MSELLTCLLMSLTVLMSLHATSKVEFHSSQC